MSLPNQDLTPESAAPTDVAPLGRTGGKPSHERTALEEAGAVDWAGIEAHPDFRALLLSKARFIAPATVFFVLYYFALPVGVGWVPGLMERRVFGEVNVAYLFALSQFFMAWALAFLYVRKSAAWDRTSEEILGKVRPER